MNKNKLYDKWLCSGMKMWKALLHALVHSLAVA